MKNIIDLMPEDLKEIKKLAVANDLPSNNQEVVDLALKMANDCIKFLDTTDFENLFNLKK